MPNPPVAKIWRFIAWLHNACYETRREWDAVYRQFDAGISKWIKPTRQQFLDNAAEIVEMIGGRLDPPIN